MKKFFYLLLAISLGLNAGFLVTKYSGGDPRGPGGPGPGPGARPDLTPGDPERILDDHVRRMTQHLELATDQQAAIRDSLSLYMPRLIELQTRVRELEGELSQAFASQPLDQDRFWGRVDETKAARSEMDSLSAAMLMAEAAVLTPEQRIKFAEVAIRVHAAPEGGPPQGNQPPRPGQGPPPGQGNPPRGGGN